MFFRFTIAPFHDLNSNFIRHLNYKKSGDNHNIRANIASLRSKVKIIFGSKKTCADYFGIPS